jgi:hypothetical protein
MSSTKTALKLALVLEAVSAGNDGAILYHCKMGWPRMTLPRSRVPLLVVRAGVAVPLRATKAGLVPLPAVTLRSP